MGFVTKAPTKQVIQGLMLGASRAARELESLATGPTLGRAAKAACKKGAQTAGKLLYDLKRIKRSL